LKGRWFARKTDGERAMQKYFAIINRKTGHIILVCILTTYFCIRFDFSFDLNITLLSIAVIFPLVFTIRQSFRRRDEVIKQLSIFRSSITAVYHSFASIEKLGQDKKDYVAQRLQEISQQFLNALTGGQREAEAMPEKIADIFQLIQENRQFISTGLALKIIRFLKDVEQSMENTVGIRTHGLPISLRAYCLVFIYLFPLVFIPTLVFHMRPGDSGIVYALSIVHGFVLMSLYNLQDDLENPFDQIGLDDIKLNEFLFMKE